MRKSERLDQILIRLGHVRKDQVDEAVARQQDQGGRIGQNLVELGALTEEQLFDGLVEQFRIPTVTVDESSMDRALLDKMPVDVLSESLIVPIGWNESVGVLSVAVANPSDEEGLLRVKEAFGAKKVRVSLAPEGVLTDLIVRMGIAGPGEPGDGVKLVALPELFEPTSEEPAERPLAAPEPETIERRAVMLTRGAVRKNFLPAVFGAEGVGLVVLSTPDELAGVPAGSFDVMLVDEEMEAEFRGWVAEGVVPQPESEVIVFRSVAGAVLDAPAPYPVVADTLRSAVQAIAEARAFREGVTPPYALMAAELDVLVERQRLGRLVADGVHLALHLLLPVEAGRSIEPFRSFTASIELAHRLRFAWPVDRVLGRCLGLYLGRAEASDASDDVEVAAQLLALVWYRHNLVGQTMPDSGAAQAEQAQDASASLKAELRGLAGRLATLDQVESYLELLEEREGDGPATPRELILVGGDRIVRALQPALQRLATKVRVASDGAEAQGQLAEAQADAIVVDHQAVEDQLEPVCRVLRANRDALVFVLTDQPDPALVLNLLDLGVDDVFGPPHEFDLIAARIHRALRARDEAPARAAPEGQFSAKFEAFSFLDLAQMLANGMKSVRVDLRRSSSGEDAVLYFVNGTPVHAACGPLTGPRAVYYVISWEDDGDFTVDDADDFPEQNLAESMESLLMEGVRLLDESRA